MCIRDSPKREQRATVGGATAVGICGGVGGEFGDVIEISGWSGHEERSQDMCNGFAPRTGGQDLASCLGGSSVLRCGVVLGGRYCEGKPRRSQNRPKCPFAAVLYAHVSIAAMHRVDACR